MNNKHFNEKDYKDVIGCKYGELMILSYTSPLKSYDSMRLNNQADKSFQL